MKTEKAVITRTNVYGSWWFTVWHNGRMRGKFRERYMAEHLARELSEGKLKTPMVMVYDFCLDKLGLEHDVTQLVEQSLEHELDYLRMAYDYGKDDNDYFFDADDFVNRTYVTVLKQVKD